MSIHPSSSAICPSCAARSCVHDHSRGSRRGWRCATASDLQMARRRICRGSARRCDKNLGTVSRRSGLKGKDLGSRLRRGHCDEHRRRIRAPQQPRVSLFHQRSSCLGLGSPISNPNRTPARLHERRGLREVLGRLHRSRGRLACSCPRPKPEQPVVEVAFAGQLRAGATTDVHADAIVGRRCQHDESVRRCRMRSMSAKSVARTAATRPCRPARRAHADHRAA